MLLCGPECVALWTACLAVVGSVVTATSALVVWRWATRVVEWRWSREEEKEEAVLVKSASRVSSSSCSGGEAAAAGGVETVVSGISVGLPGSSRDAFESANFESLCRGECRIEAISDEGVARLLGSNVVQLRKEGETVRKIPVRRASQTMAVSGRLGKVDLEKYGVPKALSKTMGKSSRVAVAAGFEALQDANLLDESWRLREEYRDSTGVVYATSFPALDAAVAELTRYAEAQSARAAATEELLRRLDDKKSDELIESLRRKLLEPEDTSSSREEAYAFDRKFLFKVLVLANAQLAQLVGARGPNLQTNAACAGTTQAIALASDLIARGRCDRVVVVSGDDASGDALMPWLGNGFNALGAATVAPDVASAVRPFDARRSGMILGAAACGLVVERRAHLETARVRPRCRLLATRFANSAFHGAAMDKTHIAAELEAFVASIEADFGLDRARLAKRAVYLSHETGTHATPSSSCAANEIFALHHVFKDHLPDLLLVNTKALTGHPMAVGVEDALAAFLLSSPHASVPPLPPHTQPDPNLRLATSNLSMPGDPPRRDLRYALRFAAGFGSQLAFALYASFDDDAS